MGRLFDSQGSGTTVKGPLKTGTKKKPAAPKPKYHRVRKHGGIVEL